MGKFARVCLKTANIDYNGRLCMVSAAAGQQEGLRHRPRRQPLGRHPQGQGRLDQRRQRRRVRPDHHQLRLAGPRERRPHHRGRSAHHADGAHLRPVPADQAGPRHRPVQRHPAPDDRERLARPRLHRASTRSASTRWPSMSSEWTPRRTAEVTGIAERAIRQAAEWWGTAPSQLPAARPRHRASHPRRAELCWARSTSCWPRAASAARAAATPPSPARATARAAASTARSATSCPAAATSRTPSIAPTSPRVWGVDPDELPHGGVDAYEIFRKIDRGEIRGLLQHLLQPDGVAARQHASSSGCWTSWSSTSPSTSS